MDNRTVIIEMEKVTLSHSIVGSVIHTIIDHVVIISIPINP